ncbi:MAG: YdeI/OmpD-associated family protein [Actinomycetota bacterium]|nr:YdeI/OmpD-associated family protein [Actinomycetota bacterium]
MEYRATVELNGRTATGIHVPDEVVAALGAGKRPAVRATVNGYTYRSTVASMGGRFLLPVSAEHRVGAGVGAGDTVEVALEPDNEPRRVEVPPDLAEALAGDPTAKERFESLSYSRQLRHVLDVDGAKTAETRQRRLVKVLTALRGGTTG